MRSEYAINTAGFTCAGDISTHRRTVTTYRRVPVWAVATVVAVVAGLGALFLSLPDIIGFF